MMSVVIDKTSSLIQPQQVNIEKLGRWIAQRTSNEKKAFIIITLCRIPKGENQLTHTLISQHNKIRGKMISETKCRKEMFKDIIECVK